MSQLKDKQGAPGTRAGQPSGGDANTGGHPYAYRWPWVAVAAGALLAIFVVGKLPLSRTSASDGLIPQEILDSHLRALMPGHLTDVESSDPHTVKAWFKGKLSFSPAVEDFAAEGFPLVGGRLDSISGRTVAALVYERNSQLINMYSWRSGGPSSPPVSSTLEGQSLVHWNAAGSSWWLVSDSKLAELQKLAALVRSHTR
ncbi:MAG TPA: hypothetical protein VMH05_26435 [Bryobacteraceae bacterium]|nr:hypothetical protein [Bryobacteraceae bacterium]